MKEWCQMTMTNEWQPVFLPPMNSRTVMLRFDDDGGRDCRGFYWRPEHAWYKSDGSKARRAAVHPVKWRELHTDEQGTKKT